MWLWCIENTRKWIMIETVVFINSWYSKTGVVVIQRDCQNILSLMGW